MIGKMKAYCYRILPLVYDQTLSYYETLCKVVSKLNEIIEFLDENIPENLALDFDNVGLICNYDLNTNITSIKIYMDLL